jgi:hypothetical protein
MKNKKIIYGKHKIMNNFSFLPVLLQSWLYIVSHRLHLKTSKYADKQNDLCRN